MSTDPYSAQVRELFAAPVHAGCQGGALSTTIDDQGVRLCLCAEVSRDEILSLRFRAWGCPHFIAATEAFCAGYEGKPVAELLEFSVSGLMQSLSVPAEKSGRILVIEDAVRSLGSIIRDASNPDD